MCVPWRGLQSPQTGEKPHVCRAHNGLFRGYEGQTHLVGLNKFVPWFQSRHLTLPCCGSGAVPFTPEPQFPHLRAHSHAQEAPFWCCCSPVAICGNSKTKYLGIDLTKDIHDFMRMSVTSSRGRVAHVSEEEVWAITVPHVPSPDPAGHFVIFTKMLKMLQRMNQDLKCHELPQWF